MIKKIVVSVTEQEKNQIKELFEHRNGLNELAKILTADNSDLYERLVKDFDETSTYFQKWWDTMSEKYQWEKVEVGSCEINFDTYEIYHVY